MSNKEFYEILLRLDRDELKYQIARLFGMDSYLMGSVETPEAAVLGRTEEPAQVL